MKSIYIHLIQNYEWYTYPIILPKKKSQTNPIYYRVFFYSHVMNHVHGGRTYPDS